MTSYSDMARRGREAARETNTRFRLRRAVEVRETEQRLPSVRPVGVVVDLHSRQARPAPMVKVYELVGDCGHALKRSWYRPGPGWDWYVEQGKRMRCQGCPIEPTPPRADGCQRVVGVEVERECGKKGRHQADGWGRLCAGCARWLISEGYLEPGDLHPLTDT